MDEVCVGIALQDLFDIGARRPRLDDGALFELPGRLGKIEDRFFPDDGRLSQCYKV